MELFINITNYIRKKLETDREEERILKKVKSELKILKKDRKQMRCTKHIKIKELRFFENLNNIVMLYINCLQKKIPLVNASLIDLKKIRLFFQNDLLKSRNYFLKRYYKRNKKVKKNIKIL